jgi:hypothetical protein
MPTLADTVTARGMVSEQNLATAFERQSIYGGSLDTLLYEQNMLVEEAVIELLEIASGLPIVPAAMLSDAAPNLSSNLPDDLLEMGHLVPVGTPNIHGIICHPETSDEIKSRAKQAAPHAQLFVAPECVIADLTGRRLGSNVPQRHALLAERFNKFLAGREGGGSGASSPPPDETGARAPTMLGIPSAFGPRGLDANRGDLEPDVPSPAPLPSFVPPAAAIPVKPSSNLPLGVPLPSMPGLPSMPRAPGPNSPSPSAPSPSAPAPSNPSGLQLPSLLRPADDPKQTLLGNFPPATSAEAWPIPGGADLTDNDAGDAAAQQALALADAHRSLAAADDRDAITASLVRAVLTQCPRVVLFSVRKAGLIALEVDNTLSSAHGVTIPLQGELGKAVAGSRVVDAVRDLDLRIAVQLERADPCVFCPVRVQERTVLVIYADRSGAEIDGAARATIASLAETAAERLLDVLVRRRRPSSAPSAAVSKPATLESEDAPTLSVGSASQRAKVNIEDDPPPAALSTSQGHVEPESGESLDVLISRVVAGEAPVSELVARGQDAVRRVMATFPGTISIEARHRSAVPKPSEHGPLLKLCVEMGAVISDELLGYIDSSHELTRLYSAFLFQEIRDTKCMPALAKLAFDSSSEVRSVSSRVLETYSKADGFDASTATVRKELYSTNITRQLHAIKASGVLRDVEAIPRLIEILADRDEYLQDAVVESLCTITAQQLGTKSHRWQNWYHDQGSRDRIQWLISSLRHRDRNVRAWSGEELRRITGAAIVFPVDGDRGQREAGVRQWEAWWDQECRRRFGT